jgi:hypothetical protein
VLHGQFSSASLPDRSACVKDFLQVVGPLPAAWAGGFRSLEVLGLEDTTLYLPLSELLPLEPSPRHPLPAEWVRTRHAATRIACRVLLLFWWPVT